MNQNNSFYDNDRNDFFSARAMATGAGDMRTAVRQEVDKIMKEKKYNLQETINAGLQELLERCLISAKDLEYLQDICKKVIEAKKEEEIEAAFFSVRKIYQQMLIDKGCSPTALSIGSVANSLFGFEKSNSVRVTIHDPGSAISGAFIGAMVGGLALGSPGAALGAAIGGLLGAICDDEEGRS